MVAKGNYELSSRARSSAFIVALGLVFSTAASAVTYHGVEFPGGAASFADSVVSYDPAYGGGNVPTVTYQDASQALGIPNYPEGTDPEYVSLGAGGRIILRFTDNSLTGSGNSNLDLWVFEIGPDVEDTTVDISKDGINWFNVGAVFGSTAGIDIDSYGWGTSDFFSFVRLTDVITEGATSGSTVGADIDALGAISSAPPVSVPEPTSLVLMGLGLVSLALARNRHQS